MLIGESLSARNFLKKQVKYRRSRQADEFSAKFKAINMNEIQGAEIIYKCSDFDIHPSKQLFQDDN